MKKKTEKEGKEFLQHKPCLLTYALDQKLGFLLETVQVENHNVLPRLMFSGTPEAVLN